MDLFLVCSILSFGPSGTGRTLADLPWKKKRANAAVEPKEIGKRVGEESNCSGGDRRPATQVRKCSVPSFAPEFDGLNLFETFVSH